MSGSYIRDEESQGAKLVISKGFSRSRMLSRILSQWRPAVSREKTDDEEASSRNNRCRQRWRQALTQGCSRK